MQTPQSIPWKRIDIVMFAAVILIALGMRLPTANRPFHRDPEGCGGFYGTLARNYFRYGMIRTFAVPVQSLGVLQGEPVFYPNHPPLLPLMIAGTYGICGWNAWDGSVPRDWQTRFPATAFTIACSAMIFILLRTRASLRAATLAAIIFSLFPLTLVFGSQPEVLATPLLFFAMLTVAAYLKFHERPSIQNLALLCLAFAPAALNDWPAFFLVPVLGLHFVMTRKPRQWRWIIAFGFTTVAMFALLYVQVVAATHDWRWMGRLVERRTQSLVADNSDRITLGKWLEKAIWHHAVGRHTVPVIALMLAWIPLAFLRPSRATSLITLLLGWTALHVIIGRQGVYVHEWWWWPLSAGAAMAAGVVLDRVLAFLTCGQSGNIAGATLLLIFGVFNLRAAHEELAHPYSVSPNKELDYTILEIGQAVRAAAPPNHAVMLAESDDTLGLWFYADRPIKRSIWDQWTFERRLDDGICDLQFKLIEPWHDRPVALVVPKAYIASGLQPFIEYLDARFPKSESPKFVTYHLDQNR